MSASASSTSPTLSPLYVRDLLVFLAAQGVSTVELFGADTVERYNTAKLTSRHPVAEWDQLVALAEAHTGDRALLLKLAEQIKPWDVGPLGFLTMASPNLRQAFEALSAFYALFTDAYTIEGVAEGAQFRLTMVPTGARRFARLESYTLALVAWHARWLARRADLAFKACLTAPSPPSHAAMRAHEMTFFQPPVHGSDVSALFVPTAYAELPVAVTDTGVADVLRTELQARMARLHSPSQLLVQQVERAILMKLEAGDVSLDDVARDMDQPNRTLQARLQQSGTSFRALLDHCRHARALALMADPSLPIAQVSDMLGFTSQSSFHHAFRRWTGRSPSEHRRDQLKPGARHRP